MIILVTVAPAVANDHVHIFTQELDLHQLQDKQWGCSICYLFGCCNCLLPCRRNNDEADLVN